MSLAPLAPFFLRPLTSRAVRRCALPLRDMEVLFQQQEKGEEDLTENWIAEAEATLNGVQRILEAASVEPETALRPFEGKGSNFEAVDSKRA